jgi:hypothetical protein
VAEDRNWADTVNIFSEGARCFEAFGRALEEQIARLERSSAAQERKARLIARRRQQRGVVAQDLVTCWFNLAAANFNLRRYEDARVNADKAADDPRFATRVQELLRLLPQ